MAEPGATPSHRDELAALGLSQPVLLDALREGEAAAVQSTVFHPSIAAGMRRWSETVAALRRALASAGWHIRDIRSVPQVVSPDGRTVIGVMSGDALTGLTGDAIPQPRSAHRKGDTTQRGVQVNGQLAFFDVPSLDGSGSGYPTHPELWLLLYHRQAPEPGGRARLRAELSRPVGLSESGHVDAWDRRILLPELLVGPELAREEDAEHAA